jgi:hypothetical protein
MMAKQRKAPKGDNAARGKAATDARPAPEFKLQEATERDKAASEAARERMKRRPKRVQVQGTREGEKLVIAPPHTDQVGWTAHLDDAFGSTSRPFAERCLLDLINVARPFKKGASADDANVALAVVDGIKPENEIEAMLAVQMLGTHATAMEMLGRAKHAETREAMAAYSGMAVKLLRTYTTQIEALAKVRRGGEQKVIVEHVHVYPGGQAIVGQVNGTGAGGVLGNARQPHATPDALAFAASPALWGQDEGRDALPVADSSRQAALPNARRGQG